MRLTVTDGAKVTILRAVSVEEGPVIRPDWAERAMQVRSITIRYTWHAGEYRVLYPSDIDLAGYWLKKDGTAGKQYTSSHSPAAHWKDGGWKYAPDHVFLEKIIDLLRPSVDALTMPVLLDHEVEL